ncbi:MAG TPA: ribosome maturation factor RimM [Ignavibacteria bacterium]|nr:ribosome maturation factor RimM [Ignavibacteria bacterium]HMR39004.1 ribosome maturation factor RimM [Ignavibacteria bacterium]
MDFKNFITIGTIVKTIGIKGNLKIIPHTDFPDRFYKLKKLFLYNEKEEKFFVNKFNGDKGFILSECKVLDRYINIKFEGYNDINDSQELVNLNTVIDEKDRIKLDEGKYYFYELIGSDIYDRGELIGKLISVVNYGSGDLFNVKSGTGEILIPYNNEFVKKIDIENKRIDVELIEGFLD